MHSAVSFCTEVVGPYFQVLGLAREPRSIAEFSGFDLPAAVRDLSPEHVDRMRPVLVRLQEMQSSLSTYQHLLTGEVHEVDLAELRVWVAYPAPGAGRAGPALSRRPRRHRHHRFSDLRSRRAGPARPARARREVPKAEEHHLAGLENDVDFVIVVKRPTDTNAMWSTEDQGSLDLISQACGAAAVRDFMTILVNTGGCEPVNVDALLDDIRRRLNENVDGRNYQVWVADAAQRDAVSHDVLGNVLAHLATALPRMDARRGPGRSRLRAGAPGAVGGRAAHARPIRPAGEQRPPARRTPAGASAP